MGSVHWSTAPMADVLNPESSRLNETAISRVLNGAQMNRDNGNGCLGGGGINLIGSTTELAEE